MENQGEEVIEESTQKKKKKSIQSEKETKNIR